jgi:FkbM family methyltransferase
VAFLSGTRFERLARSSYGAVCRRLPARFLSPDAAKARIYDRLTIEFARRALSRDSNSIDVGAHCGDILKALVRMAPAGSHWAFEPIPNLAAQLRRRFPDVHVEQVALADYSGTAGFRFLPAASAYSSLLSRPEIEAGREVHSLQVEVRRLDDLIPEDLSIAFIKIDVEDAQAGVLQGAISLLRRTKPLVVFECAPADLADCISPLDDAGLRVSIPTDYAAGVRRPLSDVMRLAQQLHEFYFVASSS